MSGSRMKVAGRFRPCIHMGCFDLEIFVEMNQRSRKVRFSKLPMICMTASIKIYFFNNVC